MKKQQTTKQVITKFTKKHGDRYDYSKVDFQGSHTKVTIICPDHGEYQQTPAIHLRGSKCSTCGQIEKGNKKRVSQESVIAKFKEVHGFQYDYTPTVYATNRVKVTVNCRIHGAFDILPDNHIKGGGCRICGLSSERQLNGYDPTDDFTDAHGSFYDYSKFVYTAVHEQGEIICPNHGSFYQTYYVHKKGHGCPDCGTERTVLARTYDHDSIIKKFKEVHGDYYDYSLIDYVDRDTPVTIVCPTHGEFTQRPSAHGAGRGCHSCGRVKAADATRKSTDWFITNGSIVHDNLYGYDQANYTGAIQPIIIDCPKHGPVEIQHAGHHIHSSVGCPICSKAGISRAETDIGDYLEGLGLQVIRSDRSLITPKEIDIYLPEHRVGIEYCGLYWHGETRGKESGYHQDKMLMMNQLGNDLITIFEDEWLNHSSAIKSILRNRFGMSNRGDGGRKLSIAEIAPKESREFLNTYHIQGGCTGSVHLGAFDRADVLVGVMVMGAPTRQTSSHEWELKRFSTNGTNMVGLMSKLFQYFIRTCDPESIVSFSDLRWFSGASYQVLGFHKDGEISPDYFYTKGGIRYHKSKFRKSGIQRYHPDVYKENLTERVMMQNAGYDRIWDCGKIRHVWLREQ